MSFQLIETQDKRFTAWRKEQDRKVKVLQKGKYANYGACGGGYTYCFTPTGMGTVIVVKNAVTKEQIDLTEYDYW